MKPKYSVIVPVYNAETTLARCVDSLLSQDYAHVQIILVNDGSIDRSGELCRAYAKEYDRVIFAEKENGGVSSARNAGLDLVEGEYITFVDSDDFVCPGYFAELDKILTDHPVDFVLSSYAVTDGKAVKIHSRQPYASQNKKDCFKILGEAIYKKEINSPWGKAYRADIIQEKELRFPEGLSIGEDRIFNIAYALSCESLYMSEKVLYTVSVENENSLSRGVRKDLDQQFRVYDEYLELVMEGAELEDIYLRYIQEALNFSQVRSVYSGAKRLHEAGISLRERRRYILGKCKTLNAQKSSMPKSKFCKLLYLPVHFKLVTVIDILASRLAK